MPRHKSFITATQINRWISASNAKKSREVKNNIIEKNSNLERETRPVVKLQEVNFDKVTRIAKIVFISEQKYRTIDRYITQNYQKHPIYSNWKTKTKEIKCSVKLTNQVLENLNHHDEELIREFAEDIIKEIGDNDLIPSWLYKKWISEEIDFDLHNHEVRTRNEITSLHNETKSYYTEHEQIKKKNKIILHNINQLKNALHHLDIKLNIAKGKKNLFLLIITFYIYHYKYSDFRINKLEAKRIQTQFLINKESELLLKNEKLCLDYEQSMKSNDAKMKVLEQELINVKRNLMQKQLDMLEEIVPLVTEISSLEGFIPLNRINGIEYRQIKGCYIIRNVYNEKYYIGQSKDILKRIGQHFSGTTPKNILFAEDYYSTDEALRSNMFEIKIIELETKDAMDEREKELILQYDSFNSGYNRTNGND